MRTPAQAVPGRLRLRFTQLKQQTRQLNRMAASLSAIGGVLEVETSPITGGFLIHFDAAIGNTPLFWDQVEAVLQAHQLMLNPRPLARQPGADPAAPPREGTSKQTRAARDAGQGPLTRGVSDVEHTALRDRQRSRTARADGNSDNASGAQLIARHGARMAMATCATSATSAAETSSPVAPTFPARFHRPAGESPPPAQPAPPAPPRGSWPSPAMRQPSGRHAPHSGDAALRSGPALRTSTTFTAGTTRWPGVRASYPANGTSTSGNLVERIASALVDRLVERSAVALVAALL